MKAIHAILAVALLSTLFVGYYFGFRDREPFLPKIIEPNTASAALGGKVYAEHCAACHGEDRKGQPNWREQLPEGGLPAPPHDENGHTWHHPDAYLFVYVKEGGAPFMPEGMKSNMPPFGHLLKDEDIMAVLSYIKSHWPPEIKERQRAITQRFLAQQK